MVGILFSCFYLQAHTHTYFYYVVVFSLESTSNFCKKEVKSKKVYMLLQRKMLTLNKEIEPTEKCKPKFSPKQTNLSKGPRRDEIILKKRNVRRISLSDTNIFQSFLISSNLKVQYYSRIYRRLIECSEKSGNRYKNEWKLRYERIVTNSPYGKKLASYVIQCS